MQAWIPSVSPGDRETGHQALGGLRVGTQYVFVRHDCMYDTLELVSFSHGLEVEPHDGGGEGAIARFQHSRLLPTS